MKNLPSDNEAQKYPVSVKGVVICNDNIILLKNERDEWELPGGKLELNETPVNCLIREIKEETNLDIEVVTPLYSYIYLVSGITPVLIIPFLCKATDFEKTTLSNEHKEIKIFHLSEVGNINLPSGYKSTIFSAFNYLDNGF